MYLILSNYGHSYINRLLQKRAVESIQFDPSSEILLKVLKAKTVYVEADALYDDLIYRGYLEVNRGMSLADVEFKYRTNPLENVQNLVFELTTECDFTCAHCRNGFVRRTTETNIERLKKVSDVFQELGVQRYDFIGGEVTRYGEAWLDLAKYISRRANRTITVYTSGWWLEKTNFEAAGKRYADDVEYLADLRQSGVTHILFSIDGCEEVHDLSRKQKGLYRRILNSFQRVKAANIQPRITAMLRGELDRKTALSFAEIASAIYEGLAACSVQEKIIRLTDDPMNHFSNFIDIGNGVALKERKNKIASIPSRYLHCKAFYRPAPSLRIMANGNLSVCPLLDAGEDFGNIHQQDILSMLNNLHRSFTYQLHARKEVKNYMQYWDTSILGEYYDHVCSVRVVLTLLARYLHQKGSCDPQTVLEANRWVASYSGHAVFGEQKL